MAEHRGDGETEAEVIAVFAAGEGAEVFLELVGGDLGSCIADEDVHALLIGGCDVAGAVSTQKSLAVAFLSGFGCVFQEFHQHIFELGGVHQDGGKAGLNFDGKGDAGLAEGLVDGVLNGWKVVADIKGLEADLGTATCRADSLAQAGHIDGGFSDVLHVFGHSSIKVVIHQHEAAETLDDGKKVV